MPGGTAIAPSRRSTRLYESSSVLPSRNARNAHQPWAGARVAEDYLREGASLRLASISLVKDITRAADMISEAFLQGNKLIIFGNGGSAADAQHIAAEFTGRFQYDRDSLPAVALTANSSSLTAIANDYSFAEVFSRQLKGLARPGDVVLGISTSGRSENVLAGLSAAKTLNAKSIGLCGRSGTMGSHCDILLSVPESRTSLIQEVHIAIGHLICLLVEKELFG